MILSVIIIAPRPNNPISGTSILNFFYQRVLPLIVICKTLFIIFFFLYFYNLPQIYLVTNI